MVRRNASVLTLVAGAVVVLAAWNCVEEVAPGPSRATSLPISQAEASWPTQDMDRPLAPSPLRYAYLAGQRLQYGVEGSQELRLKDTVSDRRISRGLQGTWTVEVLESRESQATLHVFLEAQESSEGVSETIRVEALAKVNGRGQILSVLAPQDADASHRELIRDLVLGFHLPLAEDSAEAWSAKGEDSLGAYCGSFRMDPVPCALDDARCRVVRSTARRYLAPEGGEEAPSWNGDLEAWFSLDGSSPIGLVRHDRTAGIEAEAGVSYAAEESLRLHLDAALLDMGLAATGAASARSLEAEWTEVARGEAYAECARQAEEADRRNRLRRSRPIEALDRIEAAMAPGGAGPGASADALQDLIAWLRTDDRTLDEILETLGRRDFSEAVRCQIYCALGIAGTDRAQTALLGILRDRTASTQARQAALVGMGQVGRPSRLLMEGLRAMAMDGSEVDLTRAATLTLGYAVRHGRETNPITAAETLSWMQDRYARARSVAEQATLLIALGNAADPASQGILFAAASEPDPRLRGAAMTALRGLETPESRRVLIDRLHADDSAHVRERAAAALSARPDAAVEDLAAALLRDPAESVRRRAVAGLSRCAGDDDARAALEVAASADASASVREAARQALAGGR